MKQSSTRGAPAAGVPVTTVPVTTVPVTTVPVTTVPVTTAVPEQRRKGERRPDPVLSEAYAHLSVEGLREYRRALSDEEHRVSYWRRILQARLDLVVGGTTRKDVDQERLTPLLTTVRVDAGRRALSTVVHADGGIPPLPQLEELWQRQVDPDDEPARLAFEDDLRVAETELSAYRAALHDRIGRATGELIARYRESPDLCLTALPLPPVDRDRRPRG